jgi:hypothetical protein
MLRQDGLRSIFDTGLKYTLRSILCRRHDHRRSAEIYLRRPRCARPGIDRLVEANSPTRPSGSCARRDISRPAFRRRESASSAQWKSKTTSQCAYRRAVVATPKRKPGITLFQRKTVKSKVLMIFTRQLATLIDSGLAACCARSTFWQNRNATPFSNARSTSAGRFGARREHFFRSPRAASENLQRSLRQHGEGR